MKHFLLYQRDKPHRIMLLYAININIVKFIASMISPVREYIPFNTKYDVLVGSVHITTVAHISKQILSKY